MEILKLENVSYQYEKNHDVLHNLSFVFETGKVYAIKGKSGSGKTTLLSLLSGLEKPTSGQVLYQGKNLKTMDLDKYRSHEIGIVFQSFNLLPNLTAVENIILSMDINHLNVKDKELLEKVGLNRQMGERRILKLSGGEQQRVAIARSLSYQSQLILADEPTGNLDAETEKEIIDILLHLAHRENKCVIIVTHSNQVAKKADLVFAIKKSKASFELVNRK